MRRCLRLLHTGGQQQADAFVLYEVLDKKGQCIYVGASRNLLKTRLDLRRSGALSSNGTLKVSKVPAGKSMEEAREGLIDARLASGCKLLNVRRYIGMQMAEQLLTCAARPTGLVLPPFHWHKVPQNRCGAETVWAWCAGEAEAGVEGLIDEARVKEVFSCTRKPVEATLSERRAQRIGSMLARLKLAPEALTEALLCANSEALCLDALEDLGAVLPTSAEVAKVNKALAEGHELGVAEMYVRCVAQVPCLHERIETWVFTLRFTAQTELIRRNIGTIQRAARALQESEQIRILMLAVLRAGNTLNADTRHGAAQGYSVGDLGRLQSVTSTDGKTTLLRFLVEELAEKRPKVLVVARLRKAVEAAAGVNVWRVQQLLAEVKTGMRRSRVGLDRIARGRRKTKGKIFIERMTKAVNRCEESVKDVTEGFAEVKKQRESLCAYFGGDPSLFDECAFFTCFARFLRDLEEEVACREIREEWKLRHIDAKNGRIALNSAKATKGAKVKKTPWFVYEVVDSGGHPQYVGAAKSMESAAKLKKLQPLFAQGATIHKVRAVTVARGTSPRDAVLEAKREVIQDRRTAGCTLRNQDLEGARSLYEVVDEERGRIYIGASRTMHGARKTMLQKGLLSEGRELVKVRDIPAGESVAQARAALIAESVESGYTMFNSDSPRHCTDLLEVGHETQQDDEAPRVLLSHPKAFNEMHGEVLAKHRMGPSPSLTDKGVIYAVYEAESLRVVYIGLTKNSASQRILQHIGTAVHGNLRKTALHSAILNSRVPFCVVPLEKVDVGSSRHETFRAAAGERERHFINVMKPTLNMSWRSLAVPGG